MWPGVNNSTQSYTKNDFSDGNVTRNFLKNINVWLSSVNGCRTFILKHKSIHSPRYRWSPESLINLSLVNDNRSDVNSFHQHLSNCCWFFCFVFFPLSQDILFFWQQHHEDLMSLYKKVEAGTYVPSVIKGYWKDRNQAEKNLIDDLIAHFSKNGQSYAVKKAGDHLNHGI